MRLHSSLCLCFFDRYCGFCGNVGNPFFHRLLFGEGEVGEDVFLAELFGFALT